MSIPDFKEWYECNKNYYKVKHEDDKDAMKIDALRAYNEIRIFAATPKKTSKEKKRKNKKPNPYGF